MSLAYSVHVFVSSTWIDLKPERQMVERVLQQLRDTKYVGMEHFGSRDENTSRASVAEINRSHVYVGIIGGRYGSGITELEYRQASDRGLPCFIYFKNDADISMYARDPEPQQRGLLARFKEDLCRHHTVSHFSTPDELATKVAADLHNWLFDQHLAPALEQAVQGNLSATEAQAILSSVKDLRVFSEELLSRLERAGITVSGSRSFAAHSIRDSIIVTGDQNIVYQTINQCYPELRDYVYDFSELIADATSRFVGREFVFDRLSEFCAQNKCGYFRIIADAGLGKTALAAEIARRYRAAAFFANASSGLTRPDQCLNHLCGDMIARYALDLDHLPARTGEDSRFFAELLTEAARQSTGPIVIVVDALDEADSPPPGRNPLLLPDRLPANTFVVITHRFGVTPVVTVAGTPVADIVIPADSPAQRRDIHTYLQQQTEQSELRRWLAAAHLAPDAFVTMLAASSEGNFKYLDYVLSDIRVPCSQSGSFQFSRLPHGLEGYYTHFWTAMEATGKADGWKEWNALFKPALALIAAAAEPVTAQWLAAQVQRDADEIYERVLAPWKRFLSRLSSAGGEKWRIVHQSFGDFLGGKLDLAAAHRGVAAYYQADITRWREHDGYPSRHLAWHLRGAGDREKLFSLVDDEAWYRAQLVVDVSGAAFLADLAEAWSAADALLLHVGNEETHGKAFSRAIRCALATASMRSLSLQVPPELIVQLLLAGIWTPAQAFAVVKQMPNGRDKSHGIVALAPYLPSDLLAAAFEVVRDIDKDWDLARALQALAPRLPDSLLAGAWEMIATFEDIAMRPHAARAVAERLPDSMMPEVVKVAHGDRFWFKVHGASVLAGIARRLPVSVVRQTLENILSREPSDRQVQLLAELAPHLPAEDKLRAVDQALVALRAKLSEGELFDTWISALIDLLPSMKEDTRKQLVEEAARSFEAGEPSALGSAAPLLPHLAPERRARFGEAALAITDACARSEVLVRFANYASGLPKDTLLMEAWRASLEIREAQDPSKAAVVPSRDIDVPHKPVAGLRQIEHLTEVLALMDGSARDDALTTVFEPTLELEPQDRLRVLKQMAPYLNDLLARRALQNMYNLPKQQDLLVTSVALVRRLPQAEQVDVLKELLGMTRRIADQPAFVTALRRLLPYLPSAIVFEEMDSVLESAIASCYGDSSAFAFINDLSGDIRQKVLKRALYRSSGNDDHFTASFALLALLPVLAAENRRSVAETAFHRARAIDEQVFRAEAMARLLVWLEEPSRAEALTLARAEAESMVQNPPEIYAPTQLRALLAVLPFLNESSKRRVLDYTLELTLGMYDEHQRWAMLKDLAPVLSSELLAHALSLVEEDSTESYGANLFIILLPYLSVDQVTTVFNVTGSLRRPFLQAGLLTSIGIHLPQPLLRDALSQASAIEDEWYRGAAVAGLAPYLTEDLLDPAFENSKQIADAAARAAALTALVPRLIREKEQAVRKALDSARLIDHPEGRAFGLAEFLPFLPAESAKVVAYEAIDSALAIEDEDAFAKAVLKLAPNLMDREFEHLLNAMESQNLQGELWLDLNVKGLPSDASVALKTRALVDTLHALGEQSRPDAVVGMANLLNSVAAMGGTKAQTDLALAILETRRRWP